jgi:hypothetical protein
MSDSKDIQPTTRDWRRPGTSREVSVFDPHKFVRSGDSKKTPERIDLFLDALANGLSVYRATRAAGITRITAYKWRDNDEEFAERWAIAVEEGTDRLEDEAMRRAMDGVERPMVQGGEVVALVKEYSDSMMTMMLKGRRRSKFGDRVGITGGEPGDQPIKIATIARVIVGSDGREIE